MIAYRAWVETKGIGFGGEGDRGSGRSASVLSDWCQDLVFLILVYFIFF